MPVCRLIVDSAQAGAWNMAVDEMLLNRAAGEAAWSLRFYTWSEPTLSLGYFQSHRARESHRPSARCAFVRRPSGGGAILHDQELTYCLVAPASHPLARDANRLYRAVHAAFVDALASLGIPAQMYEQHGGPERPGPGAEPFLCFQRRSPGDLVVGPNKIAGSAQRRRGMAVLQHGSFLLRRSPAAPELPGLEDLYPCGLQPDQWQSVLSAQLSQCLEFDLRPRVLSEHELVEAKQLEREKHSSRPWRERR
jgi:lipoate-protein ligase A